MLLVIDHRDTNVRYESKTLCVRRKNKALQRIPLRYLTQVVVYGNPQIEVAVFRALSHATIPTILLSSRGSQEPALLANGFASRLPLRSLQWRCSQPSPLALEVAKWFIRSKVKSYIVPMSLLANEHETLCEGFWQRCEMGFDAIYHVGDIQQLMGIEGQISRNWFALLQQVLDHKWQFHGRNRRPPRDPVNALLSLAYTLLATDVRQLLISEGFDHVLGFLHQPRSGREALVLDMLEVFRSGVDHFVLTCLADLEPKHFNHSKAFGCRLIKEKRGYFYAKWALCRQQWPQPFLSPQEPLPDQWPCASLHDLIRQQAQQLRLYMEQLDETQTA